MYKDNEQIDIIVKLILDKKEHTEKRPLLVAIDGRCASGKTTLSDRLADGLRKNYTCDCLHMDDFFLPLSLRTDERLQKPGENVDHERFYKEVLIPLSQNQKAVYRPFLCGPVMDFGKPVEVNPADIILIEGAYACHPQLYSFYDLKLFVTIDSETQLNRIEKRNGLGRLSMFKEKWIPLEEKYIKELKIEEKCDFII